MRPLVIYKDLGLVEYRQAWDAQREIFDGLVAQKTGAAGDVRPTLILCEHPHVYTLGKSGDEHNLLMGEEFLAGIGATYVRIDRGGDITYHGPGQLVGYPILDLEALGLGLRDYIHTLEGALIETVADFGIAAGRLEGAAGVWLTAGVGRPLRKIAAIGVRSSRHITMHGFALNVCPMLEYFGYINPCGFTDRGVTSIDKERPRGTVQVTMDEVKRSFLKHFGRMFRADVA
ncbi:MAG: lipoyl(octanoyl) transferase LipB [Rikenellaceae bacterium]|nr:lipoyl(octanoyl) transferase LipB [Rikenellaceae bacterium]MCL2692989.1 lipoyl(octanoyl) transferase LipB [Rikenellaceae bacterium]